MRPNSLNPLVPTPAKEQSIMKSWCLLSVVLVLLAPQTSLVLRGADSSQEEPQIAILQSDRSPREKDAACARLKHLATARAVPALAALLADEQLSHSARYVLESMSAPEAGRALIQTLDKTSGSTQAGIIHSIGFRREPAAVPALTRLLGNPDAAVASAVAQALGKIGDPGACAALEAALDGAAGPAHLAVADAILMLGVQLRSRDEAGAAALFQRLYDREKLEPVRVAAYRGLVQASPAKALDLITGAILGPDGAARTAALQLVREVKGEAATQAFVGLLSRVEPGTQIALVEGLAQRGEASAVPALTAMIGDKEPAVRLSAIAALGLLGDGAVVPALAGVAAAGNAAEQKAARLALTRMPSPNVNQALLALLASTQAAIQTETVKAMAGRGDQSVVPRLLELAVSASESTRKACCQGLALLAGAAQVAPMAQLLAEARSEAAREDLRHAIESLGLRLQAKGAKVDWEPIVKGSASGAPETRAAFLALCGGLIDPGVRGALRRAVADADDTVRAAAIRALCDTRDGELLLDVLKLARENRESNFRILAFRGMVRMTQEDEVKLPDPRRVEILQWLSDFAQGAEEKRLVLAGLANRSEIDAFMTAFRWLDDTSVQGEAAQAATRIAGSILGAHPEILRTAMKKVVARAADDDTRKAAAAVIQQLEAMADYLTAWEVAGPYAEDGKDYQALFDRVFPPETAEGAGVLWKALAAGADRQQPYAVDLLKALGGEQKAAYARTQVYSESERAALLELGSDDGIKVWLNGKLIHANKATRALTPGTDKVTIQLRQGWNSLLLKITQNNQGWGFCARLVGPGGKPLEGVRFTHY